MMILDVNSEYLGVSTLQLMENAGRSIADEIGLRFGKGSSVVIYGGTGRNGGDGMVTARHLASRGFNVTYRLVGETSAITDSATANNWRTLKAMPSTVKIEELRDSTSLSESESDVLVDALLGTGVRGKLRQPMMRAVEVINASRGFKVAVDVPTGIDSDTGEILGQAVRANLTVTLHSLKKGFLKAKKFCGEVKVADIGIPPEAADFAGPGDVKDVVLRRSPEAHKGEFGRLLVIGGSEIYSGAPTLVALAAYRAGTDLVFVATPEKTAQAISSISPNLITLKLPGENLTSSHIGLLRDHFEKASAIAVGPGLGTNRQTVSAIRKIVTLAIQREKPLLLDADGLNALGVMRKKLFDGLAVITPHAGEFQAVSGNVPSRDPKTRSDQVKEFASKSGAIVLLKGHTDIISDGVRVKLNNTGNPGMTVGGTGDVLSGIVAGLMAQGIESFRAAVAGAFINGAAGDLAEEKTGDHLVATDLLEHVPRIMNDPICHKAILERRLH
jgi:ADP-dependent NAD(P)H-hydrate dehydratase / NAD(P)H-hydrate epimerase